MQFVMFTKHLQGLELPQIIEGLKSAGMAGADLCVRPGYPVNPENVRTALPEAAKRFADAGLSIPLVTTPGDFVRADMDYAEPLYAACGQVGVKHIKLGYWHWAPEHPYWQEVDKIRGLLEGFQRLSARHGVQTVIHNHSGRSMGLNSAAVMNLVKGFEPKHIGVFADAGHLSICGEPIDMAIDMVRDYLALFAFKDLMRERVVQSGKATWQIRVVPLGHGFVEWGTLVAALKRTGFGGVVSMHSEYSGCPVESVIDMARIDLRFIKGLLAQA
jgi:sugar phosphate isomerase/epimerase